MLQPIDPSSRPPVIPGERYINRDLSWLAFNERVLEEAASDRHPVLERVRFLAIAANNLDEFYMVHVAGVRRQIDAGIVLPSVDGLTPLQLMTAISERVEIMLGTMRAIWKNTGAILQDHGISIISRSELTDEDREKLRHEFERDIFPLLTPLAISPTHPFPFIPNRGLAVAVKLQTGDSPHDVDGIVRVPAQTRRFIRLAGSGTRYIPIEDVIQLNLDRLFPGFGILGSGAFRLVRDSDLDVEDLEVDDDAEHLLLSFETALHRRSHGEVVRLSATSSLPADLLDFLILHLDVPRESAYLSPGLIGLANLMELVAEGPADLLFKPFTARYPGRVQDFAGDCFAAIRTKDLLIHHPYESFDVVVQFIRQAVSDPAVVAIKQTLYRTSADSPIVQALIEAAHAGKSVTAVVELKARFDEEANLKWARDLERAGAQVTYGFIDLKIHAKLSLVVRREAEGLVSYIHFGTGNYHPLTARVYTDLSLFSCDPALCADAGELFNYMTGYAKPGGLRKVAAAPISLRSTLIGLIESEIENAEAGKPAAIWFKVNGLTDPEIIDHLYRASQAGVVIRGVVRGMCALRARVPGLSENIRIHSIVGRFLEHSRIVCFANGADLPSDQAKVFISSADWMSRNLDRRIETLVPIEVDTPRLQVMEQIMIASLKDDMQSWELGADNSWRRVKPGRSAFSAHDYFMNNPSLSGRGSDPDHALAPRKLRLPRT